MREEPSQASVNRLAGVGGGGGGLELLVVQSSATLCVLDQGWQCFR